MRKLVGLWAILIAFQGGAADPASGHGMLLFGEKAIYLSHLPMFHSPHDYQVILEASLDAKSAKILKDARTAAPNEKVWTIDPQSFVLPTQIAAAKPFTADIYQGHFERGGKAIARSAPFRIESVVHFRKFRKGAVSDKNAYFTFGRAGELFAAHWIAAAPDFDRIVSVSVGPDGALKELSEIYFETGDLEN